MTWTIAEMETAALKATIIAAGWYQRRPCGSLALVAAGDEARAKIQRLLVTGDNRLKQGVAAEKARESYEQALAVAREAGIEDAVRPLVEFRLADLERLSSPSSDPSV